MSKTSKELLAEFSDDHVPYCGEAHNEAYSKVMDMVISPKPKQYQIGIDTFQRAKANLTKEQYLACLKFNIDKYCWREKGQDKEDFEKIIAYAKEAISVLEQQ